MKTKTITLKIITEISRVILGITFVFSGLVKAVDPMGTAYKIEDYFLAFGLQQFSDLSLILSVIQCVGEFALGAFLLLGIYRRVTTILILLVMLFMTPLTLYLAIANPVSDCGCFGDAWVISNWQTFYKNIVLLTLSVFLCFNYHRITNLFTGKFYWAVGLFVLFYITAFSIYNCYFEPVFDFRPYKIGANLPQLMSVEDGKGDIYENIFIYEKDGKQEEFTEANYPWQDTTWMFVDRKTTLIKEGEKPLINDFSINKLTFNDEKTEVEWEEDITQEVLSDPGYTFLMIAYSLSDMSLSHLNKFEDISSYANDNGYKFYCLTASTTDEILKWEKDNAFNFVFGRTDERTLKTIVRANPGLILLKDGVILNKWADIDTPNEKELNKPLAELSVDKTADIKQTQQRDIIYLLVLFIVPLVLIKLLDFVIYQRKKTITN